MHQAPWGEHPIEQLPVPMGVQPYGMGNPMG